jgi:hypothetical protein
MTNDPVASPLKQPCERPSEVGYKNPPLHSRFQPGHSGNPKGRPKGRKNVRTILREALQRKYRGREGNQEKTKAVLEWLVYGSMQRAIAGKPGALRNVRDAIALAETAGLAHCPKFAIGKYGQSKYHALRKQVGLPKSTA